MKIRKIKEDTNSPDNTFNMYRLNKNHYQNLLRNAIPTTYRKADKNI